MVDSEDKKSLIEALNQKLQGAKESMLSQEIVKTIFSEESNKILRTARIHKDDMSSVRAYEAHQAFFVEDYCLPVVENDGTITNYAEKFRNFIDKCLIVSNAEEGKFVDKLMDTAKMEAMMQQSTGRGDRPDRI